MFLRLGYNYEFTGKKIRGRKQIRLLRDLDCGYFIVPKGFLSDGASIPSLADNLLGLDPLRTEYLYAAVLHDFAYSSRWGCRWKCDWIFFKFILNSTKRPLRWLFAPIMLFSVRIGGFEPYYRENRSIRSYYGSFLRKLGQNMLKYWKFGTKSDQ